MRTFPMTQLDVFTANPLEGNALAVFTDARGLSDGELQALARETNLSETTFVFPRDPAIERERGVRVRIFTVAEELPFAGHPTLGTATVLRGSSGAQEVVLDLDVGRVPVRFEDPPDGPAFGEMTQVDPVFGPRHDHATLERALGLPDGAVDRSLPVETVSTGMPFTIVPLASLAAAQALAFDPARGNTYLAQHGGKFFYFVSRETVDPEARLHARMLFYGGEDPATGSAAGCCIAWAVAHGVVGSDERVLIEQGLEMKRPSRIFVRAGREGERVTRVRVGGTSIKVMSGSVALP